MCRNARLFCPASPCTTRHATWREGDSMFSSVRFSSPVVWAGMISVSGITSVAAAGIMADSVLEYVPGVISSSTLQQNGNSAIGLPASIDDGQTSPFTPPFHAAFITVVGAGGHVTLHLSSSL